jgi:hypothetical protein
MAALARARSHRTGGTDDDDLNDPIRGPLEEHERMGELVVGALLPLLTRIAAR